MKQISKWMIPFLFAFISCEQNPTTDKEHYKSEILQTEKEFSEMAQKDGIAQAFLFYAADDAVLMRNNKLVLGKPAIRLRFEGQSTDGISLTWTPDFVDVAASGDLGYTYGQYAYSTTDSLGNVKVDKGIFHTVWKRQKDGKWRFVWD
ncbi:MAG: nuclear transport factor 2 family protein [Bacteroidales bacterium]|nr:nuclear transport factor 2 family protein [Bacteroidales bacterium]MCF8457934.1 nuclear transport factor 2 family protein [Bacteroidales bacterium]